MMPKSLSPRSRIVIKLVSLGTVKGCSAGSVRWGTVIMDGWETYPTWLALYGYRADQQRNITIIGTPRHDVSLFCAWYKEIYQTIIKNTMIPSDIMQKLSQNLGGANEY